MLYFRVERRGGRGSQKGEKEGGKKRINEVQDKEYLQVLTADICLISLDARGKAFYLNTSKC